LNPIVINGTVLCDNITGIPRYVYENVVRLDKLIEGTGLDVRIAYRDDGRPIHLPELKNIRLVPLKSIPYFYNLAVLPAYLRRTHAFYVGLASDMLLTRRSVVVLHDIRPLVMDTDKGFFRFKFWVHCLSTKWFAQRVFTVSDNQRHLISEKLGIPLDKIGITYNGWEHMKNVTPDESIFDKMPGVKKGEYFYALGSLAKHKNFKWIREVARRSPDKKDDTGDTGGGDDGDEYGDDGEDFGETARNRRSKNNSNKKADIDADGYARWECPWSLTFNYSVNYGWGAFDYDKLEYSGKWTQNLSVNGNLRPTPNWNFNMSASYNFDLHKISYMNCSVSRDLHCFTMTCSFIPVGPYKSFNFHISVKASMLRDLKWDKRSSTRNGIRWY